MATKLDQATIDTLVAAKVQAKALAGAFGDAIESQAKKHGVKKGALRRYIAAIADDKVADVNRETGDLAALLG